MATIRKWNSTTQAWEELSISAVDDTKVSKTGGTLTGTLVIENSLPVIRLNDTNNESDYEIRNANGNFSIYDIDNATYRLLIQDDGNVGIGTTTPSVKLDVNGDASVTGELSVSDDVFIGGNQALTTTTTLLNVTDGDGTVESLSAGDTLEFSENGNINFDFVAPGVLSVNATNNYADSLALNGTTLELGRSGLTDLTVDLSSLGGGSEPEWEYVATAEGTSDTSLNIQGMSFDDYTYKIVVNAHQDTEVTSTSYYPYLQFLDSAGSVITSYSYASSLMGLYSTNETSQTAYTEYNFLDRYENAIRLGVIPSSPETIYDDTGFYGEFTIAPIFPYYTAGTVNENYGFMLMGQSVISQGYNLVGQYEAGSTTNLYGHGQAQVSGSFVPDDYDQIVPDGIRVYWYGCDDMDIHIYRRANRT